MDTYDSGNRGYFRHIADGHVLEARYQHDGSRGWHGTLWLGSWLVKEAWAASQAEIAVWCWQAWVGIVGLTKERES